MTPLDVMNHAIVILKDHGINSIRITNNSNPVALASFVVELSENSFGISGVECWVMMRKECYYFHTYALDKNGRFKPSVEIAPDAVLCRTSFDLVREIERVKLIVGLK